MSTEKVEEVKRKLKELNSIVATLDPALRDRALDELWPSYFPDHHGGGPSTPAAKREVSPKAADTSSAEAFFTSFEHKKPSENVLMIVAWLYSQYGVFPISAARVR